MTNRTATLVLGSFLILASATGAMAQYDLGHPRINEVDHRLIDQQDRINAGLARGQIGPGQALRDERLDARVSRQLGRDEAQHGGHITFAEQAHVNREFNRNSRRIYAQRH
jgi:hypothetical protein